MARSTIRAMNAGQYEQDAGDQAAEPTVEQPAEVDRELLGLGAGEQHAEVEGVAGTGVRSIQRFSSTRVRCMTAICPAGPPKVCRLIRNQAFTASRNGITSPGAVTGAAWSGGVRGRAGGPPG